MSPNQLLFCALTLVPGLQTLPAFAQTSHDPAGAPAGRSLPGPGRVRRKNPSPSDLVHISPTTLGPNSTSTSGGDNFLDLEGFDLRSLIARVARMSAVRIDLPPSLDLNARYDVSLSLPTSTADATMNTLILKALEDRFHLTATRLTRPTDVYVVSALGTPPASFRTMSPPAEKDDVVTTSSFSFRAVTDLGQNPNNAQPGLGDLNGISMPAASLDDFCQTLEGEVDRPVVNETHLQGAFNFNLASTSDTQNDLLDQLRAKMNLVIQPANRTVEFLVFRPTGSQPIQGAQAVFVRSRHSKQTQETMDWDSWLAASCQIEPGSFSRELCAKSGLPDRTQELSAPAPRDSASRRSAP